MPRRVLLASMDVGGGHRALRDSLHAALAEGDPDATGLGLVRFDSQNRSVDRFYSACVRHLPAAPGALWTLSEHDALARWAVATSPSLVAEIRAALLSSGCELVIATHPLLSLAAAKARRRLECPPALASAVPDYGAPTTFFYPRTASLRPDHLLVFSEEARGHLVGRGAPPEHVHLSGFLTDEAFVQEGRWRARGEPRADRLDALSRLLPELKSLFPSRPTALFLGGSGWTQKTWPLLERILSRPALAETMNLAVVCGRDEAFKARLRAHAARRKGLAVFGFLPRPKLAALMAVADVPVLGSLAPATLHELLEVGLGPLLVFRVIPGSEPPHVGLLEREGLGQFEPDPDRMVAVLEQALRRPAEGPWARLARTFSSRAQAVRASSRDRARRLPSVVQAMLGGSVRPVRARARA